ncbi:MAG: hypothetical protein ABFD89_10865 [Bryobacteraceae bacterium]
MADFRKWIPVLAVGVLVMGAATANADTFQCSANAGVTPLVRAEGIAELAGDLLLNCSGTVPTGGITSNIRIFANTTVTSKLAASSNTLPQASEALLLLNDPAAASQVYRAASSIDNSANPNVFQGTTYSTNVVDWYSIPIAAAGSAGLDVTKTIRITNIRVNAAQLGVSSTLVPQPIQLSLSISGGTSVGINNPTQTVAWVQKGLTFSASGGATSFKSCEATASGEPIIVAFTEGFASAFKAAGDTSQQTPGASYNTEGGMVPAGNTALGVATQGSRLLAQFNNVPTGITLTAQGTYTDATTGLTIKSVSGADTSGAGGTVSGADQAVTTGGTVVFVWEVTAAPTDSIGSNEVVSLEVTPSWTSRPDATSGDGITVQGNYAPISTVTTASYSAPVPRFQDTSSATTGGSITIEACRTVLLFPYVTNASGFDTGIAISNTSADPFETAAQSGTCALNYYGNIASTGGEAPDAVTTPEVEAGEQLAFIVSSGGSVVGTDKSCTACATPGFHGYVIAVCNFQYAHGFAFVSDLGSANLAEGYLALVIPDKSSRDAQAFSLSAAGNDGEQLVH